MRAKEYIEQNQSTIQYLEDIKRVINELMPLRKDKEATDEYYNHYLLSDWRLDRYKIAMQDYQLNNDNSIEQPILEKKEGEISALEAPLFRSQLFEIIKEDESFGYLFYQLGLEKNQKSAFYKSKPIQCIPDDKAISKAVAHYRDDYPKKQLDEYLDDTFNYEQYCFLTENNLLSNEEKTLLDYFNTSYEIYDKIRCLKNKLSQINQYCNQYNFGTDTQKYWTLSLVVKLIEEFEAQDAQLERCKKEIQKMLRPLELQLYPNGVGKQPQPETDNENRKNVFTTAQQILFFHYILNEIGINFGNTDKAQWVRFINTFTGKNAQDIKEKLNFDFDNKKTKRDLSKVAAYIEELMPQIAIKIKNDTQE